MTTLLKGFGFFLLVGALLLPDSEAQAVSYSTQGPTPSANKKPNKTQKKLLSGLSIEVVDVIPKKISFKEIVLEVVFALDNGLPFELQGKWMGGHVAAHDPDSKREIGKITIPKTERIAFKRRRQQTFSVQCNLPTKTILGSVKNVLSKQRLTLNINGEFFGSFLYLFALNIPIQQEIEVDVASLINPL